MPSIQENMSPSQKSSLITGYLPTLDGWRAIAVLLVMGSHTSRAGGANWYDGFAVLGVEIFFGISGILICQRLLDEFHVNGKIGLKGFYLRRALRILPPAWLYLLVISVIYIYSAEGIRDPSEVLSCLLFYRNYTPDSETSWYTGHFWSLMVEEHFYILFPLTLAVLRPRRAIWVLPLIGIALLAWRVFDDKTGLLTDMLPGVFRTRRTDLRLANLVWGCWLSVILYCNPHQRTKTFVIASGYISLALVVANEAGWLGINGFLRGILIPFMLYAIILTPKWPLGKLLELSPLRWIGKISYSLYLWQQLCFVQQASFEFSTSLPFQQLPWNIAVVFVLASASFYLIEKPCVRLGHRIARPATSGRPI